MTFQFDHLTQEFIYKGQVVGDWKIQNGQGHISLSFEYEVAEDADDIIQILANIGLALKKHEKQTPPKDEPFIIIETLPGDIESVAGAKRTLVEVTIKRDGYKWRFYLTDVDPWPSRLHAHDYDQNLKLDALTGKIYDVGTRSHCDTLKSKKLTWLQEELKKYPEYKKQFDELSEKPKV